MSAIEKIQSVTKVNHSDEQLKILNHKGGMRILACAGSGKTTVLTHLLAKRIIDKEIPNVKKLLVTTYSVAGREELETRINSLLNKLGIKTSIEIRTLHSAYMYMLKQVGSVGQMITNSQRLQIIREGAKLARVNTDDETVQKIDSLISYQINNMLSSEALFKQTVVMDIEIDLEQFRQISSHYESKKRSMGLSDFDDLQFQVWWKLKNDADTRELFRSLWDDFYIDEFQDVSRIQFEILKMQLNDEQRLVVIGDDDQAIYKWRGADPSIIQNVCGYYDIASFLLSTNYRCKNVIVDHAANCIRNNSKRDDKQMMAFTQGGKLTIIPSTNNLYEISRSVKDYIFSLLDQGVGKDEIAVLCRNNAHGVILDHMLTQRGIQPRSSGDMRFGTNIRVGEFKQAIEISENTYSYITANGLWKYIQYLNVDCARAISSIMKDNACSLKMALKSICTNIIHKHYQDDTPVIPWVDGKYTVLTYKLSPSASDSLKNFYEMLMLEDSSQRAINVINQYLDTTLGFIYKGDDMQRNMIGIGDYIIELIRSHGLAETKTILIQAEMYAKAEIEPSRKCITVSTMHGSKGKEWKYVIILGDDNIAFPSFNMINDMLKKEVPMAEIADFIEQERRLHYVAMTRAKEELRVFTVTNKISVFLLEALQLIEKQNSINTHVIDIVTNNGYTRAQIQAIEEKLREYTPAA